MAESTSHGDGRRRGRGPALSRRSLIAGVAGAAGLGVGATAIAARSTDAAGDATHGGDVVEFHGVHQAGVTTPPTAHVNYVGLDLSADRGPQAREALAGILRVWTEDAARLTRGTPALADSEPELARLPARLTVTVGLGPGAFTATGLEGRRPRWLHPLPAYPIDRLDERRWGQTDLLLQICSDDPVTVAHATRVLTANVAGRVRLRWVQRGFRNSRGSQDEKVTMRNLMGQVDGTVNLGPADSDTLVWDDGAEQPWFAGGTSMVLRRIAMDLDGWQEVDPRSQELSVGRTLTDGAPLSGGGEHDDPDFDKIVDGLPAIPASSHIARARHRTPTEQFLRRGYNYDDPPEPDADGTIPISNSGLLFAAYQRDVDAQYVPVQARLAEHDALNQWTTPIGSAVYAVLPGARRGEVLGQGLLG
ncbi:Dyp-type peroxidase [Gordonia alkanivorans]|uniref:Dyp-type peroxidase n=1 Tax=Gordonia alkanivorans TaxID=84096 RepID=UPI00244CF230|nr:Dyp-type peroxidase [Gordonia alkanivorans]MDH3010437.1 Dyp-type peroxidase [Gordonia alkanivorans]MDH3022900.1 Dyp-type peroxidase [Gordonia alkanivorans]